VDNLGLHISSGDLLVPAAADTMRLVQKELAVAQSRFRILVYRYDMKHPGRVGYVAVTQRIFKVFLRIESLFH
jgi:hypothetical protein